MSKVSPFPEGLLAGELARLTGVSTDTLRHYERKGVLPKPNRLGNGYRKYPPNSVERVRLIRRALAVGFTLDELAQFLKARDRGKAPCREVHALAGTKLYEVESRLAEMTALRDELRAMLKDWDRRLEGKSSSERVGLLDALAETGAGDLTANASLRTQPLRRKRK
jgi:DNA-binding transcriptional MerR regulator